MKFSASISDIQKVLQKTIPAMPRKSTLPVLEHLNFSLKENVLTVISTDQDITIMSVVKVESIEDGAVLVPGRKLSEIAKLLLNEGIIEFEASPENFEIKIKTRNGKYQMKGLNPSEYLDLPELFESEKPVIEFNEGVPELKSGNSLSSYFSQEQMRKLCEKTVFAVSKDEYRPAMTGVFLEFLGDTVNAVATDSYRLAKVTVKNDKAIYPNEFSVIIPSRAVELMRKVDGNVVLSFIETMKKITHARFDLDDTVIITRVIDEKFPPYRSVIPAEPKFHVMVNEKELINSVNRVSIFASENSHQIKMVFENNNIFISGEDEDSGSGGNETITCDYQGETMLIGFNYKYLAEAFTHMESEIEDHNMMFSFSEPNKPILLTTGKEDSDIIMLVMPVRLS